MPLAGAPMILRQVERVRRASAIDQLVVATSDQPSDDPLAMILDDAGVEVFRGPLDDVLARFIGVLDAWPAEHVVRLTGDCPLIDPELIDATIARHLESGADYTNNLAPGASYPKGQDVELITADALRRAAAEASTAEEREHVTWGVRYAPERYRTATLAADGDRGSVRWTVDRPDDYAFVSEVYAALYADNPAFTSADIRAFLRNRPDLINYGGERRL